MNTTLHLLILLCILAVSGKAQTAYSFEDLNNQRIHTNAVGMKVLATWGAVNTIGGIAGYVSSDKEETRYFHQMNAIWGIVNAGIATAGYLGTRKELQMKYTCSEAFKRYKFTRQLYLINAGLDGVYIGTGLLLVAHSVHSASHVEMWRGYGNSIIMQGVGLLIFDAAMYSSHNSKNKLWRKALQGVCITGNGLGWYCRL